jgi:hypothetical protein
MAVMAIAVIFEPVRLALAVLMLNRPRPMLQLLSFVCGGFVVCVAAGLAMLFILRATPLAGVGGFSVAKVHIAIGLFALLIAVGVATNISGRRLLRRPPTGAEVGSDAGVVVLERTPPSGLQKVSTHARRILRGSSLWVAGVFGLANLPSANYMAALAVILASGASPAAQVHALLTFNVVAFTLVGTPLITYVAAPQKTRAVMAALHAWLLSRRRRDVAALVTAAGCVMLALGMSGL